MKFAAAALLGLASATSEQGIAMLQKLNSLPQDLVDMDEVKVALVECSVAGDCSAEAAAMPHLALAAEEPAATTTDATAATTDTTTTDAATTDASTTSTTDSTTTATKQTALQKWEACVAAHGDKACAKEREAAFNKDAVAHAQAYQTKICVDNKKKLEGLDATTGELATGATTEQKAAYDAWKAECAAAKEYLKVAQSGDLPWIIVGSVVGLVCVAGAVFCYCKNKNSDDA